MWKLPFETTFHYYIFHSTNLSLQSMQCTSYIKHLLGAIIRTSGRFYDNLLFWEKWTLNHICDGSNISFLYHNDLTHMSRDNFGDVITLSSYSWDTIHNGDGAEQRSVFFLGGLSKKHWGQFLQMFVELWLCGCGKIKRYLRKETCSRWGTLMRAQIWMERG